MITPQLITADSLAKNDWEQTEVYTEKLSKADTKGRYWVLARPYSIGGIPKRIRLAWGVFTGKYDALKWIEQ